MSEPTTLGEALTKWESIGSVTFGQAGGSIEAFTKDLRRILYGTDEPCPTCEGSGCPSKVDGCPICHGTGRIKTPGVGDRLKRAFLCGDGTYDGFAVERLLEAIRREIGEAP